MVGIADILNNSNEGDENDESNTPSGGSSILGQRKTSSLDKLSLSLDSQALGWERTIGRLNMPRKKINKKYLSNKRLVQISLRRKSASRKSIPTEQAAGVNTSKLHIKYLEAGMRVKLTMAPSIFALYNSLIPHTNRKQVFSLKDHQAVFDDISKNMEATVSDTSIMNRSLTSKSMQLIDNNLVNLAGYSHKVLQTFGKKKGDGSDDKNYSQLPTFNSLDTAVSSLFGITDYTLVRVTRSTSNDSNGSVILKLETAKPGDYSLIDDEDFAEDMIHSIGKPNDTPNSLFIKKILARPRYKSDMKIFFIPKIQNSSLYVDERMFERDLIKGIIDLDQSPCIRNIFCTFKFDHILHQFKNLVFLTKQDEKGNEAIENEDLTENCHTKMTIEDYS